MSGRCDTLVPREIYNALPPELRILVVERLYWTYDAGIDMDCTRGPVLQVGRIQPPVRQLKHNYEKKNLNPWAPNTTQNVFNLF